MVQKYDVIVIGGGIIGLSCAYYLSKNNQRVLVLESGGFADGASGSCDDMILFQSKKPGINLELAFESLELYKSLREELDDDLGFANYGGMVLIQNADELEIMERFVQQQRSFGLDVEILSKAEMRARQPFLSERFIASTYSPMDAQADPFAVMHGFSRAGAKRDMTIVRHTPVIGIERDSHGDFVVSAANDRKYRAPRVVNAAGTWAGQIANLVGESIPITPKRGQIIITEKIPVVGQTNLWSAKYLVTKLDPNYQVASSETERELGLAFAFTRSSGDSYLIGSTREYAGYDKKTTMEGIRAIIQQAVSYLPVLKDVHFIRAIAGLRPSTPDGKMILGEHQNLSGFFTAAGHEGDGISLAPITGKLLAEMVCSGKMDQRLSELSPNRFLHSDKEEAHNV
ncbi:MAG: FAD-binding oxidoreductase [Spirochaetae bacterium HGW-Spirochaetae-8]|jgi:sarcosine oxidase subunit beta|nr:MAG: FAD-binding oxidoreductase [Spirochaetae bacterium HGW-Spirochaetae-8]